MGLDLQTGSAAEVSVIWLTAVKEKEKWSEQGRIGLRKEEEQKRKEEESLLNLIQYTFSITTPLIPTPLPPTTSHHSPPSHHLTPTHTHLICFIVKE